MNTLYLINSVYFSVWLIQAVRQLLNFTYWLQVKEYRHDRFRVKLGSKQGRNELEIYGIIFKLVAFFTLSFVSLSKFTFLSLIVFGYLLYLDLKLLNETNKRKIRKPVFTLRIKEIILISLVGLLIILFVGQYLLVNYFRVFLLAELALITLPFLGIYLTKPLVNRAKNKEITRVRNKYLKYKPVVIGVTGSYGKTTTKDFIYQLLKSEKRVSKTPGSHNTEFGLARAFLSQFKKGDKYFVAEYGAYKKGEISKLTKLLKPNIAVITSIEPQHLELFGSIENISAAKYELFESLKVGDTAIFNIGNENVEKLYKKAKNELKNVEIMTYSMKKVGNIWIEEIIKTKNGNKVIFRIGQKTIEIDTNIKADFLLENLLPSILIARKEGVSWESIKETCQKIVLPENTMDIKEINERLTIIDDSHNLSPTAFRSSIRYLSEFKNHRIYIVTPGMIELGKRSSAIHKEVAEEIKKSGVDKLILTNNDTYDIFRKVLGNKVKLLSNFEDDFINNKDDEKLVILLAGRVPVKLKKSILELK